jgi:hypothetical protein
VKCKNWETKRAVGLGDMRAVTFMKIFRPMKQILTEEFKKKAL